MRRGKIIKWCIGIVLVCVLGLFAVSFLHDPFFRTRRFNAKDWREGDERLRGRMVRDLLDQKILEGKTKTEVLALLGMGRSFDEKSMWYKVDIGQRFGSGRWIYDLTIEFDETNTVVREIRLMD